MKTEKCNDVNGMEWANEWAETWGKSFCKERNDNVDIFYNSIYLIILLFLLFCLPLRTDCVTSASNDLPQFTKMSTPSSSSQSAQESSHRLQMQANDDDDNIFILFITSTFFFDKSLWGNDVFCQHDYTINNFSSSHHSRPNKRTTRRQYLMEGKNCDDVKKYIYRFHMLQWGTMEKYITSRGARAESGGDHNQKSLGRTKTIMGNFISNFIENVKSAVCDFFLR